MLLEMFAIVCLAQEPEEGPRCQTLLFERIDTRYVSELRCPREAMRQAISRMNQERLIERGYQIAQCGCRRPATDA